MASLEMNKVAAAVLTAGIVAMLSGFIAKQLVHPEAIHEDAYPIAVPEGQAPAAAAPQEPVIEPVLPLLANADPAKGQALTKACQACHSFEQGGPNKVGPNLYNIVGAPHAHAEGFNYSSAMQALHDKPWTYSTLNHFIAGPRNYIPGTRMTYAGMRSVEQRADLIAYLRTLSPDPKPLPTPEEIAAAEKEAGGGEGGEAAGGEAQPAAGGGHGG